MRVKYRQKPMMNRLFNFLGASQTNVIEPDETPLLHQEYDSSDDVDSDVMFPTDQKIGELEPGVWLMEDSDEEFIICRKSSKFASFCNLVKEFKKSETYLENHVKIFEGTFNELQNLKITVDSSKKFIDEDDEEYPVETSSVCTSSNDGVRSRTSNGTSIDFTLPDESDGRDVGIQFQPSEEYFYRTTCDIWKFYLIFRQMKYTEKTIVSSLIQKNPNLIGSLMKKSISFATEIEKISTISERFLRILSESTADETTKSYISNTLQKFDESRQKLYDELSNFNNK